MPNFESRACGLTDRIPSTEFLSLSTDVQSVFLSPISSESSLEISVATPDAAARFPTSILISFSLHAPNTRYEHLPKPALYGAGAAGYSGDNTENEQIYADTQCRIFHAEISILNSHR